MNGFPVYGCWVEFIGCPAADRVQGQMHRIAPATRRRAAAGTKARVLEQEPGGRTSADARQEQVEVRGGDCLHTCSKCQRRFHTQASSLRSVLYTDVGGGVDC